MNIIDSLLLLKRDQPGTAEAIPVSEIPHISEAPQYFFLIGAVVIAVALVIISLVLLLIWYSSRREKRQQNRDMS